jgi:hypothetical protein
MLRENEVMLKEDGLGRGNLKSALGYMVLNRSI